LETCPTIPADSRTLISSRSRLESDFMDKSCAAEVAVEDAFAAKRAAMREEFFGKLFLLGGWLGATDTYKRTMWSAVPDIAIARAGYGLTMRRGLPEPEAGSQLIMAGHEAMLAQWFHRPLRRSDIELARRWFADRAAVRAFPTEMWDAILAGQLAEEIYLPVDVWGFPGGQTFLPGVPCMFFEGMGGAISYLEPAMCRYFAPIIQATKGRLMKLATPRDAEFGLRSSPNEVANIVLLLARFVGGGGRLTSNDTAEFLFPELFRSVGTIGHEMICAAQSFDRSLGEAEYEMMERFVLARGEASLLCDLVDAETVGLENALRVMRENPDKPGVGIRVDSGDIAGQCVLYFRSMEAAGISPRLIVFEDEVTPERVREVYDHFRQATGRAPDMLFPGAGGYWWRLVHRDTVAAAFKRSATGDHPNVKFSSSPGKESLGGYLRAYGREGTLIVADASEPPPGEPLFVKLVDAGRIVYRESFQDQAARADRTWGRYKKVELSARIREYQERFVAMREREVAAARDRLVGK
jgi:nicotinic acid phosphoribosyltransferase